MSRKNEFTVKSYAGNQFVLIDVLGEKAACNNSTIDLAAYKKKTETEAFIQSIIQNRPPETGIEDYCSAVQTARTLMAKLEQFTSS